ncbi:SDR family NAD(P)-dependent oxidoreductase [Terricaulis sp.]|uniref:SDR family NAD(P)-dependent oxidoreductase n=1 Tax=Terricaulis sp. TaxID=2768686 RepID=UPI003784FAFA
MKRLEGKVALITGSGRGIGRALALKLAREGARVVVNDLDEGPAADVVREIRGGGGEATAVPGSVTEADFGERFVDTAMKAFGGVDIIVSNAGYTIDSVIQKMTDENFDKMIDVHLKAPFRILRAAAEPIRVMAKKEAQEGREVFRKVVLISSVAGTGGNVGQVNYSSAKAGLIGMTKSLSKEWGRYKVCVNCVAFGLIGTRLAQASENPEAKIEIEGKSIQMGIPAASLNAFRSSIPLGREGTPEEAADGVYLFCSPESNYVSGQVVIVGGGLSF